MTKRFGGVVAVNNLSFDVKEREILGIIGPNGAGKTTLLNVVNGIYEADSGEVYFRDERISDLKPYQIARKGIGRTFQITSVFRKMPVVENLLVPVLMKPSKKSELIEKAIKMLEFVGLEELKDEYAENLSGGQKMVLEFARALMSDPQLLLMDEPFAGVHPVLKSRLINHIRELNERGKTFILISHDIPSIMGVCERVMVVNMGELIAEGKPSDVRGDTRVIESYLGV
ncbi:MAG: ABC transporter ATP-binding protein [Candidatus Geothermarchaeales archaeon]